MTLATGRQLRTFAYAGEGWGLTTDGERLYMTRRQRIPAHPRSGNLSRCNAACRSPSGVPRYNCLNELEWIDGKIWANVYVTDQIVIIDPASGHRRRGHRPDAACCPDEEIAPDDRRTERHRLRRGLGTYLRDRQKTGANSSKSKSYPNKIPHDVTKNRDIRHELEHRILLLDGGFGTMIQQYGLDEADYRGKRVRRERKTSQRLQRPAER